MVRLSNILTKLALISLLILVILSSGFVVMVLLRIINSVKPSSCWLVLVMPYNLPPKMFMKDLYVFLTCIIPDPDNPKAKIDVYPPTFD